MQHELLRSKTTQFDCSMSRDIYRFKRLSFYSKVCFSIIILLQQLLFGKITQRHQLLMLPHEERFFVSYDIYIFNNIIFYLLNVAGVEWIMCLKQSHDGLEEDGSLSLVSIPIPASSLYLNEIGKKGQN